MQTSKGGIKQATHQKPQTNKQQHHKQPEQHRTNKKVKGHIVIPYTQCPCKSIKNGFLKYSIKTYFKSSRTLKNILVAPKDKGTIKQKSEVI